MLTSTLLLFSWNQVLWKCALKTNNNVRELIFSSCPFWLPSLLWLSLPSTPTQLQFFHLPKHKKM